MISNSPVTAIALGLLAAIPAAARTDLGGCTSTTISNSIVYYVPDTGEICNFIDCGGGRAPPKTTQPGCAGYTGTATVTPSFLDGFGSFSTRSSASSSASSLSAVSSAPFSLPTLPATLISKVPSGGPSPTHSVPHISPPPVIGSGGPLFNSNVTLPFSTATGSPNFNSGGNSGNSGSNGSGNNAANGGNSSSNSSSSTSAVSVSGASALGSPTSVIVGVLSMVWTGLALL